MTPNEYLKSSARTCKTFTDMSHVHTTDKELAANLLGAVLAGNTVDCLKRRMFYKEGQQKSDERAQMNYFRINDLARALSEVEDTRLLGSHRIDLIHAAMGLMTEAAEILEETINSFAKDITPDRANLKEEFGDTSWYTALGLRAIGSTHEEVFDLNEEKLVKRFPIEFTEDKALNRDLTSEHAVFNQ